uniref:NudC domain-containing protein 1 n=1 Tax=Megafenestra aurita TaxID=2291010 RepID=A0A4Y7NHW4_9CRUS|nr:EOG090X08S2 [Megafenestra aurita]SVE92483.1 EOG090X08S2 [Megafenestra aurita]
MAKLFELRPNKDLLNHGFEGYKLSLDPLPAYKHNLPVSVEHLQPSDQQFSYQHVKTFGLHNHLIDDPFHDEFAYFISNDSQIFEVNVKSLVSSNPDIHSVWRIPIQLGNTNGRFNMSLSFACSSFAVATDGVGNLHIVDTCNYKASKSSWQVKFSHHLGKGEPFKIMYSTYNGDSNNSGQLSVLVLKVEQIENIESKIDLSLFGCNQKETPFLSYLEWVEYEVKEDVWSFKQMKRIVMPRGLDYASILNPGKSLCLIAQEPFGTIYDSTKHLSTSSLNSSQSFPGGGDKVVYIWGESPEEVWIRMSFPNLVSQQDLAVEIHDQALKVVYRDLVCLNGELAQSITVDTSRWALSNEKLEIVLSKNNRTVNWNYLIFNDVRGQKVDDAESAAEWHHRLIHMTAEDMHPGTVGFRSPIFSSEQLEECDDFPVDETHLYHFDGETNAVTHKAILNGNQLLFLTKSTPGHCPGICLRHDVDGLIWQPMNDEPEIPWSCQHTATLQALGYIQASKQQRKFTVAPHNMSYAALCDAFTHIYIYRQSNCSSNGMEMLHRPTGRKMNNVARQQVLNIDTREECLGALATNNILMILSSSLLFAIHINCDG